MPSCLRYKSRGHVLIFYIGIGNGLTGLALSKPNRLSLNRFKLTGLAETGLGTGLAKPIKPQAAW